MSAQAQFRQALADSDIGELRRLWRHIAPHLPQDLSDDQAEIVMRRAQTEAESIPLKVRAYAHRWLAERGLPSGLPDDLKPKAERMYPVLVTAVGISVNTTNEALRPAMIEVRQSMEAAVEDAYAEGRTDPAFVSARMAEARRRTMARLLGSVHRRG